MRLYQIKKKLKYLPECPGIYIFKGKDNAVIYVGSSNSLKNRVSSYFTAQKDPKTQNLVDGISGFDYIAVNSLKEALILENNLIKKYKPRYNIKLKDDKKYPFIEIAAHERFPFMKITRNTGKPKCVYFGPYTNVKDLRRVFYYIRKIFKIRTCAHKLPRENIKGCLYRHINLCSAPCLTGISEKDYNYNVGKVIEFLNGKTGSLIKELRKKIKKESSLLNFEACAYFQNIINKIREISEKQGVLFRQKINADYAGLNEASPFASLTFLSVREGALAGEVNFLFKIPEVLTRAEIILYFFNKIYADNSFAPPKLYLPFKLNKNERNLFKGEFSRKTKAYGAKSGINKEILFLADKNSALKLESGLKNIKPGTDILYKLKKALRLRNTPYAIKAVDVSNLFGTFPTGSVVAFTDGAQDKNKYRHYIIKGQGSRVKGQERVGADPSLPCIRAERVVRGVCPKAVINDYAMIKEIIERNLSKKENIPDLLIIDGGKGHLNAALKVIKKLNIKNMDLISIAKKEELIYVVSSQKPLNLRDNPAVLNFIRRIRDESHRFAVKLHRIKRNKILQEKTSR